MYSQNNEEKIIEDFFGDYKGSFLDLGANDGKTLSNTHLLSLKDWWGVCVEPSPKAYEKLQALYKGNKKIQTIQAAIAITDGPVSLYESDEHLGKGDSSLLSTIIPSEMDRWKNTQKFEPVVVEGITVETFLKRSSISSFDFISIDCEGLDYFILEQLKPHIQNTSLICVEFNNKDREKFVNLMFPRHKLLFSNFENLIFGL
jgi:FkbM family methyltransferase